MTGPAAVSGAAGTVESAGFAAFSNRYRRVALTLLVFVAIFNAIDRAIIAVLFEPIKQDLQLNDLQLGLVSGIAFSLFYATLGVPFARWADFGNRRTLLSLTVGLWSIMTVLSGCAHNFLQLFLARVGVGIGEAGGHPAALSVLSELYPIKRGGTAIALFLVGGIAGSVIALWGGGAIATHYGWRTAFFAMGVPGVLLALVLRSTLREPRAHCRLPTFSETVGREFLRVARELFAKPSFFYCVVGFTIFGVFGQGSGQWIVSYMVRHFGLSLQEAGAYLGLAVGASTLVGMLLGGAVANFIGARDVRGYVLFPAVVTLISTPLYLVVFTSDSVLLVVVLNAMAGLLTGLMTPSVFAVVFGISGIQHRATGIALLGVFAALVGGGLGPLIIGGASDLLAPHFGERSLGLALLGSIGFMTCSTYFFWRASMTLKDDFEVPPDELTS